MSTCSCPSSQPEDKTPPSHPGSSSGVWDNHVISTWSEQVKDWAQRARRINFQALLAAVDEGNSEDEPTNLLLRGQLSLFENPPFEVATYLERWGCCLQSFKIFLQNSGNTTVWETSTEGCFNDQKQPTALKTSELLFGLRTRRGRWTRRK